MKANFIFFLVNSYTHYCRETTRRFTWMARFIWVLAISLFLITGFSSIVLGNEMPLTPEEEAWLKSHPKIHVGIMNAWPPMNYVDHEGRPEGIGVDYLNAINKRLGGVFKIVPAPFKENLAAVKSKKLDVMMDITPKPDREPFFNFTAPYLTIPQIIVGPKDGIYLNGEKDLYGKTIALEQGYYTIQRFKREYPEISIREYQNTSDCLDALSRGEVDAYVGNRAVAIYLMEKELITNLSLMGRTSEPPVPLTFGTRKDWPELAAILNKALGSLPTSEIKSIHQKWTRQASNDNHIELTHEEQVWLAQNRTIQVRITDFPPYIIPTEDGVPQGIAIDSLKLIAKRTGVKFSFVSSGNTFSEALQGLENHQGADVFPTLVRTPEREKSILFTRDFMSSPYVIFMRSNATKITSNMDDLIGKKVALLRGGRLKDLVKRDYPEVKLALFDTHLEAIDAVANNEAEAYIGNLTMASYHILQNGYYNMRLVAPSPFGEQVLAMGVRNDWPELASILDKGLASIAPEKHAEIRNRYISLQLDQSNTSEYIKWILIVLCCASATILLFIFWNRSLSKKVAARTKDLQESEKELKEKSDFLDKIIESAALSTWISDKKGFAIRANSACLALFGAKEEEVIGKYNLLQDVVLEKNGFMPEIKQVFEQGRTANIVIDYDFGAVDHVKVENASHRILNSILTPIKDDNGNITNVIVQAIDITEIKKLERELIQSRKMESIGQLAGGIAHDFNNILASILGFSELALDDVEKGTIMEDNLKEILAGGLRAKEIVKQILAFARQSEEVVKPTRIDTIIIEALKLIGPSTPTTIEIRKSIESSSLVMGNATQIHQVLMNLCTNASQAMLNSGGILEVSLTDTVITEVTENIPKDLKHGEYIKLIIADTGGGIAPEHMDSIFDPYFTTKKAGEGTGLGLAMVRGIIDSYGGKIIVESIPSIKTVFTVYLPVTRNMENTTSSGVNKTFGGSESILFVDDEPAITRMGSRILQKLGYTVTTSTSSIEALEIFKATPDKFALVITDMTMPYMTGDKFALELKQIREDIRIILCTGYSNKISSTFSQEIGVNAFTFKPFSKEDLAKIVREVLDKA